MLSIAVKPLLLEQWKGEQKPHAEYYLLFPGNMSSTIAIDEVSLTKGELYTIISSLARSGRKGNLIAVVAGTNGEDLITVLSRLPKAQRNTMEELTLDMSPIMRKACESLFLYAKLVTDSFHAVHLCAEGMQKARIDQRWKKIDKENKSILRARKAKDTK